MGCQIGQKGAGSLMAGLRANGGISAPIMPYWGGQCLPPPAPVKTEPRRFVPDESGPAKVHIITLMVASTVYRQCSPCRQINVYPATETRVKCKRCGHRADVNKAQCDCVRCSRSWIDDAERGIRREKGGAA